MKMIEEKIKQELFDRVMQFMKKAEINEDEEIYDNAFVAENKFGFIEDLSGIVSPLMDEEASIVKDSEGSHDLMEKVKDWTQDFIKMAPSLMGKDEEVADTREHLELNIGGLKCDTPTCDYNNTTIKVEDYEQWIDKGCPKCGASLLTQADYDTVTKMIEMFEIMNQAASVLPAPTEDDERITMSMSLDGSGKLSLDKVE